MWDARYIDLGHLPGQAGYAGLEHRDCNRGAPNRMRGRRIQAWKAAYAWKAAPPSRW